MGAFGLDISKWVKKAKGNGPLVVRKIVLDVGNSMVEKTPVGDPSTWKHDAPAGYAGGRARGSWQHSTGAPLAGEPGTVDDSGQATSARLYASVQRGDAYVEHFITSNVPYMRRLEYDGWSKQAPAGMVRITIAEYQDFLDNAVRGLP